MASSECYLIGMKEIKRLKEGNVVSTSPLLSLCIPTNGVLDWVAPVLHSIYDQDGDEAKFEVVVTDNGDSKEFQTFMQNQVLLHKNLHYRKTDAQGFLNQIECFRDAQGTFIKFVNHRMMLKKGVLADLLDFVANNQVEKPIAYFLNGSLPLPEENNYRSFDEFVGALSYYSSWSGGLGIWRDDFLNLPKDISYNSLFPHTTILFQQYKNRTYYLNNRVIMESLPENHPKGRYNLFFAFAVEYPSIICDLYRNHLIRVDTFLKVKRELLTFLAALYLDYFIFRRKCSYDLNGMKESIRVYYSFRGLAINAVSSLFRRVLRKIKRSMKSC